MALFLRSFLLLGVFWKRGRGNPMHEMGAGSVSASPVGAQTRRLSSQSISTQERLRELDTSQAIPSAQTPQPNTSRKSSAPQTGSSLLPKVLPLNLPELDSNAHGFRILPIISTIFVPFALFLAIPGITEEWYIQTNDQHMIIHSQENPVYLQIILDISLACAVLANTCIIIRLFEKLVQKMTIICIVALSVHDVINIVVIVMFIVKTQEDDGFILGQAFWMTVCSSIASMVTNVTLVVDLLRTKDVDVDGSGLTKKQRSLANIIIVLLCYIAFGAAVHTALLNLSYINALYYTVVCIETIGFGDINPSTANSRIFTCIYTIFGNFFLAIAIGLIREALLEAIQVNLRRHLQEARRQRIMHMWVEGIKWRLERARLPVWVSIKDEEKVAVKSGCWPKEVWLGSGRWRETWWHWINPFRKQVPVPHLETLGTGTTLVLDEQHSEEKRWQKKKLNMHALSRAELQAAAMEAGLPLEEFLPTRPDHLDHPSSHEHGTYNSLHPDMGSGTVGTGSHRPPLLPTHHRMGKMVGVLGNFALAVSLPTNGDSDDSRMRGLASARSAVKSPMMLNFAREERKLFVVRVSAALALFLSFWMVGSGVFSATEKWSFALSVYFCFVSFTTIGFGDPVPQTPAGRSFFVGWALLGVGTMTILISILADRSSERYKKEFKDDVDAIEKEDVDVGDADMDMNSFSGAMASTPPFDHHRFPDMPTPPGYLSSLPHRRHDKEKEKELVKNDAKMGCVDEDKTGENVEFRSDMVEGESPSSEHRRLLSRINKIEALVVDEVYAAEDRLSVSLAHLLESELQTMLGLVKRSKSRLRETETGTGREGIDDGEEDDIENYVDDGKLRLD